MWLLILLSFILFVPNSSLTKTVSTITNEPDKNIYYENQCQQIGDQCEENNDCCSELNCYSIENENLCLPSDQRFERYTDDLFVPPYYNPKNYLYPYGTNMPPFPFYNAYGIKQKTHQRNKMEWDHCQFHEDCGEGNCCYVHFRFRSLPKSFCRPNRNPDNELCEPLTKYRSLKDVPAWKKQKQQMSNEQQQEQQPPISFRPTYYGQ